MDRIDQIASEEAPGHKPHDLDEAFDHAMALLRRLNQEHFPDGDYVYVDVIETVGGEAVALPPEWFAGDRDSRWALDENGYYQRVRGPSR